MRYVFLIGIGYAVVVLLAFLFSERLLFFPYRELWATPESRGMAFEDVDFQASDGTRLHGWFVPADGASRATVLFCHGNAGNISHRLDSIDIFHRLGLSVFIFDYRGYGRSEGTPSEKGVYSDVEGAWRRLTGELGERRERVVMFGRSLGGAVAAYAAEKFSPGALILESTFTDLASVGQGHYFFLPVRLIVGDAFNTIGRLERIHCPVLVAASPEDEVVPGSHGKTLFEAAGEPKMFLQLRGDHNLGFLDTGRPYVEGLDTFITSVFGD
ncbi:MAG: alpha/beta hydrolase [Synergistaceae bacterium]|nr:alpha/beta hydrolase [Synergistota bacterium]NLM70586.1 alpha/beta hydrolase [Synergistaceae bacterium]